MCMSNCPNLLHGGDGGYVFFGHQILSKKKCYLTLKDAKK